MALDQYGNYTATLTPAPQPPATWPGFVAGGAPDSISYAGPPTINPPLIQNIVVDSNGRQWQWFNNQWN